jgi:hypothetical protein
MKLFYTKNNETKRTEQEEMVRPAQRSPTLPIKQVQAKQRTR